MSRFERETFNDLLKTSGKLGTANFYVKELLKVVEGINPSTLTAYEKTNVNILIKSANEYLEKTEKESIENRKRVDEIFARWEKEAKAV